MEIFMILWVVASFVNLGVSIRSIFYLRKATRTEKEKILSDPNFQNMALNMYQSIKKESEGV